MFFLSEGNLLTKLLLWSDDSIGRIQIIVITKW